MAKAIMIQGTASNSGKTFLVTGLCRIFKEDGYRVAPFKSQNMTSISFITKDGLTMGRAQAMQAEAAGIVPDARMNPILLKPTGNSSSQVIVNGSLLGEMSAIDYYAYKDKLRAEIASAYESLAAENDIIVIEGAGSPAEINLKQNDIVNMGMAEIAKAPVLLAGDIDRGGVFAALAGTMLLLTERERSLVAGVLINKFRGDAAILQPGLRMLEDIIHKPVLGTIPMLDVVLEAEDSLSTATNSADSAIVGDDAFKESQYRLLAEKLRSALDMKQIYKIIDEGINAI
ncbi:MAG: cobyric acid synthase [Deferribacteraceae bacterium]|jgi:adenosylcobyric acid synthase|nr:cobyric acid synthase [Deferribacteraceae bacterium]